MVNVFSDDSWDLEQSQAGYTWKRMRAGRQAGGELLGASVFDLPPGQKSFPLHYHHSNEEMLVVLAGRPTARTPDGERELSVGDLIVFRRGSGGAHQVMNRSEEPTRFLIVSTMIHPEIGVYPESEKVGLFREGAPGAEGISGEFVRLESVDYFDGED